MTKPANQPNRRFRLRCGAIVEERPDSDYLGSPNVDEVGGFIDVYRLVDASNVQSEYVRRYLQGCSGFIALDLTLDSGYPQGGSHGKEFDIIEEIKEEPNE